MWITLADQVTLVNYFSVSFLHHRHSTNLVEIFKQSCKVLCIVLNSMKFWGFARDNQQQFKYVLGVGNSLQIPALEEMATHEYCWNV